MIEEYITEEPITINNANKQINNLEIILNAYNDIAKFGKRQEIPLSDLYGRYCKKLERIKVKLKNEKAINFIDSYIDELSGLIFTNHKCNIEITDVTGEQFFVLSNFHLFYARPGVPDSFYAGQRRDVLVRDGDHYKILKREIVMDMANANVPTLGLFL